MINLKHIERSIRRNHLVWATLQYRDLLVYRRFRGRDVESGRAFAREAKTGGANFCFAVAFNTPWVVDALTKAWVTYTSDVMLVVVDNSSSIAARKAHQEICAKRGIPYLELPKNPEANPARSHGIAMNWVYYNIVQYLEPETFGFIDHDCLPIEPFSLRARLGHRAAYGWRRFPGSNYYFTKPADDPGWFLWAGLCFYRYAAIGNKMIDFRPTMENGMDTGGGNWAPVYSKLRPEHVGFAVETQTLIDIDGHRVGYQTFDGALLHIGGASYKGLSTQLDYRRKLSDHIWNAYLGGSKDRLVAI
ncbi:conserved hypothetical protein [Mesorhizobium sp. ORS 3324]|nr:conserved hypothetical protein [Mesorhizobium sp. ORS 3324]